MNMFRKKEIESETIDISNIDKKHSHLIKNNRKRIIFLLVFFIILMFVFLVVYIGKEESVLKENKPTKIEVNKINQEKKINNNSNKYSFDQEIAKVEENWGEYEYPEANVREVESARGKEFEVPKGYEIAIEKKYDDYRIIAFRENDKKVIIRDDSVKAVDALPDKPILVAILKEDNTVLDLFIFGGRGVLSGSVGYGDYDKEKIKDSIKIKDIDNDGLNEILVYTYTANMNTSVHSMVTLYFDKKESRFIVADREFRSTYKLAYKTIEVNKHFYVLEAEAGSGSCSFCPTPYFIRIHQFWNAGYFDIGSVGLEGEYDRGFEAINDALPRIIKKILSDDVFPL